jgi:hypothetical protein
MVSIEQVKLLESRVVKAIEYVEQVNDENALLKNKLDLCQKRVDELEVLIQRFKEDQGKIEESILSALDRLNQFEDAMGKGISKAKADVRTAPKRQAAPDAGHEAPVPPTPVPAADPEIPPEDEETFVIRDNPIDPLAGDEEEVSGDSSDSPELGIF